MFNRKECKQRGKAAFKRSYWMCVLAALVLVICLQGVTVYETTNTVKSSVQNVLNTFNGAYTGIEELAYVGGVDGGIITTTTVSSTTVPGILLTAFILNIIAVGCYKFFVTEAYGDAEFGVIFDGFRGNTYGRNLVTMFLKSLFTVLWMLLLIVPGIIKGYEYSMIPYILAENPDMGRKEVFAMSKELTAGSKWKLFVFDLSYIGWFLLSVITFGILDVLYVQPYYYAAKTQVYLELKAKRAM